MGLLDSVDLEALAKKVLDQYDHKSDNSPLTTGLLSAGLGILANANRPGAEGIGTGGLLGLQAYSQAKQAQAKDPNQLIATLSGLQGLQSAQQQQRAMDQWQGQLNGVPPQPPQYGMQDRSSGVMPSMAAQQAQALGPDLLQRGMMSPNPVVQKQAESLYNTFFKPYELSPGQQRYQPGVNGQQNLVTENVDPTKPRYQNGQVSNMPGQVDALAEQERAKARATAEANAANAIETVTEGGRPRSVVRSQFIAEQQGTSPQQLADVLSAYQRYKDEGDFSKPFSYRIPNTQNPTKAEEAGQIQAATIEGDIRKNLAETTNKSDREKADSALTKAQSAYESNQNLAKVRQLSTGPNAARGGMMAPTLQSMDAFLNGVGIPFNAAQFKSTEEAQTYINRLSLEQVKAMLGSTALSDNDVKAVKAMMPQIANNPEVRLKIIDTIEKANDRHISQARKMDTYLREKGSLQGFDYGLKTSTEEKPEPVTSKDALLNQLLEEAKKRGLGGR